MAPLMCQTHRQHPGLDIISLLTDTLCALTLPFLGKNKATAVKHGVDTHAWHLSFHWSLPKRSVYQGQPHLAGTILLKPKLRRKIIVTTRITPDIFYPLKCAIKYISNDWQ